MKIAIISDTHDNLANTKKAIDFLNAENIDTLLHCGDICNQETLEEIISMFKGKVTFVRGNGDYDVKDVSDTAELVIDNKKIAFIHYPDLARKLAESGNYDLVFYGHTHRPWEETIGKCRLVNPGELAGQRYKPCFALYDTQADKLELKILEKI